MEIKHDLIAKLYGKSDRAIEYMLKRGQLTQEELLEFSLFVATLTLPSGGILGKRLMESIRWGLEQGIISGLNPALQGLQLSHTHHELRVSERAKRKARKAGIDGDELFELAYLMSVADEGFFQDLRARVETDLLQKVWSREEFVAQLTHKRAELLARLVVDDDDAESSKLH